jgi:hypothetical protein
MTRALLIPRLRLLTGALAASAFIALAVAGTSGPAAGATSAGSTGSSWGATATA